MMQSKKKPDWILVFIILLIVAVIIGAIIFSFHLKTPTMIETQKAPLMMTETIEAALAIAQIESQTETTLEQNTQMMESTPSPAPTQKTIGAVEFFRNHISQESYSEWIRKLSGDKTVMIGGQENKIETRYSYAMFTGQQNAKAKEFLLESIRQWVSEEQITQEEFTYTDATSENKWINIIVTFPGEVKPEEEVLFTAHYDSCVVFEGDPMKYAPGANDNGTGVATVLEAIRIFSQMKFDRTVKIVLFSGEENFQQGSKAYAAKHASDNIIGVINMDMYGTDKDNDRCFEMYVGDLSGSHQLADLMIQTIQQYGLNLKYDYLTGDAYSLADQTSFWNVNIPAITAMENFLPETTEGGCGVQDRTDFWHLPGDTIESINLPYAFDIGLAGTITVLNLAGAHPVPMSE
ncbi:MAG: Zn-dependent exopeptidase M28 [Flexilinea flocculi]|nr:Zn-dependent exopeptidase M28 [Flexilinea flocculi]